MADERVITFKQIEKYVERYGRDHCLTAPFQEVRDCYACVTCADCFFDSLTRDTDGDESSDAE